MMSAITYYQPFLVGVVKPDNMIKKIAITTSAALLLAISSQFIIPLQPVPVSLQSLVVLLIGGTLGRKLAVLSIVEYIGFSLLGLPVLAGGTSALTAIASPSTGYVLGFLISAYLAGWVAEKGLERRLITGIVGLAFAHQMIFVIGVTYLKAYLGVSWLQAVELGYLPFAGVDAIKFVFAALFFVAIWKIKEKKVAKANTRTNFISTQ